MNYDNLNYQLPVVDVLTKALEIFTAKPGKGTLFDSTTGCHCSLGAIARACGATDEQFSASIRLDPGSEGFEADPLQYERIHPEAVKTLAQAWANRQGFGNWPADSDVAMRIVYGRNDASPPLLTQTVFREAIALAQQETKQ